MDSNPFESLKIFCFGLLRNCLNCDYNFDGHIFISKEILLPRYGSFIIITTFVLQVDVFLISFVCYSAGTSYALPSVPPASQ